jgi:hypothetical protein
MYRIAKSSLLTIASLTFVCGIAAAAPSSTGPGDSRGVPARMAGLPNTNATAQQIPLFAQLSSPVNQDLGQGGMERHANPHVIYLNPAALMGGGN